MRGAARVKATMHAIARRSPLWTVARRACAAGSRRSSLRGRHGCDRSEDPRTPCARTSPRVSTLDWRARRSACVGSCCRARRRRSWAVPPARAPRPRLLTRCPCGCASTRPMHRTRPKRPTPRSSRLTNSRRRETTCFVTPWRMQRQLRRGTRHPLRRRLRASLATLSHRRSSKVRRARRAASTRSRVAAAAARAHARRRMWRSARASRRRPRPRPRPKPKPRRALAVKAETKRMAARARRAPRMARTRARGSAPSSFAGARPRGHSSRLRPRS
mmetsp:Transcript_6359/g.25665  ORF Transcript_6359/g.25665 Transcript_6359/m.25665 type:complete len:274 (-) Transcript_6359:1808-2629(-)